MLGDRVAIMSHGKIQALGTALGLKKEYGGGYKMNVIVTATKYKQGVQGMYTRRKAFFNIFSKSLFF